MSVRNVAELISANINLKDGEPDFLVCVALQVEVANGYLFPSHIVVRRDLDDVFDTALDGGHLGGVEPRDDAP